jgi:hypothetical protein
VVLRRAVAAVLAMVAIAAAAPAAQAGWLGREALGCSGPAYLLGPRDDVRIRTESAVPAARDILTTAKSRDGAQMSFRIVEGGADEPAAVRVRIGNVRDLALPRSLVGDIVYDDIARTAVVDDARSRVVPLWPVDEATAVAADLAYEIEERWLDGMREDGSVPEGRVLTALPGYQAVGTYLDVYTGFKAVAFEKQDPPLGAAHRIYAIAGTQVFVNTDFRDWAAGLTMARSHMVSSAALRMIADAAAYAASEGGGEVFITGQSQGALTAQGVGFLLQAYLDAGASSHRLVHVVAWGAAGALEPVVTMVERQRTGLGRDFPLAFERHWARADPEYHRAMAAWARITRDWSRLKSTEIASHIEAVTARTRSVGYFFEIDPFARAGTFLGTSLVFPTAFVLPAGCDQLVTELMFQTKAGKLGITLESHFLKGYLRAVERGALAVARPAEPEKWQWVMDLMPTGNAVGRFWLGEIYRDRVLSSPANWRLCEDAEQWRTNRNQLCREEYWPGCSNESSDGGGEAISEARGARWCLIEEPKAPVSVERHSAPAGG